MAVRFRVAPLILALAALAALLATPFLPVVEHTARYQWDSTSGDAALPLSPYRPERLAVTLDCAALRDGAAVTTVRSVDPGLRVHALTISEASGMLAVRTRGRELAIPLGTCRQAGVTITEAATTLTLDGVPARTQPGDLRPPVDGFSDPRQVPQISDGSVGQPGTVTAPAPTRTHPGIRAEVVADTQWDTSPTPLKLIVTGIAYALLAAAITTAILARRTPRTGPRGRLRLGLDDAAMAVVMLLGAAISGTTNDDGFIAQILRTRALNGRIGNFVRWTNAPEAPFGWFYDLYALWGRLSMEPVWLRLAPLPIAYAGWLIARHGLLPRLTCPTPPKAARWSLLGAYAGAWLVFGNSLRPEIWFATGIGAVVWLLAVAHDERRCAPLIGAAAVTGLTIGVGPVGILALAPWVCHVARVVRARRRDLMLLPTLLAAGASVVPLMFADQSWSGVVSATRARTAFGPAYGPAGELLRYRGLLDSPAARQIVVGLCALTLIAAIGWLWRHHERITGTAMMIVMTLVALPVVLAVSPTKVPHHFGAVLLIAAVAYAALIVAGPGTRAALSAGTVMVIALGLHHNNAWWELSALGQLWARVPRVIGTPAWYFVVMLAVTVAAWCWLSQPRALTVAIAVVLIGLYPLADFAQAAVRRGPHRYTLTSAAIAATGSTGCQLERTLAIEPDPAAGALRPTRGEDPFTEPGPAGLKQWRVSERARSGYFPLPEEVRQRRLPLVIAVDGLDRDSQIHVTFGSKSTALTADRRTLTDTSFSDIRILPPADATEFQLDVIPAAGQTLTIAQPRVPVTRPFIDLSDHSKIAVAWNLAFFAPCLPQPAIRDGRVDIPTHVLSDSQRPGNMSYASLNGGPFAGVLGLTIPTRVALYAPGDLYSAEIRALDLVELKPAYATELTPQRGERERSALADLPAVP